MINIKNYNYILIFSLILLMIDILWIKLIMSNIYHQLFNNITLKIIPAIIAYLFMILGYIFFILPDKNNKNIYLTKSFLFGIILFGVYAFTLLSILPNFNYQTAILETVWGGFLYLIASLLTYLFLK